MRVLIPSPEEKLMPLSAVPRDCRDLLPPRRSARGSRGKPRDTAIQTIIRWANRGLNGEHLEVLRVGGTLCTTREAIIRFFQRLTVEANHAVDKEAAKSVQPDPINDHQRADAILNKVGF